MAVTGVGCGRAGGSSVRHPRVLHGARDLRPDRGHAGAKPAAAGRLHWACQPRPRRLLRPWSLHGLRDHAGGPLPLGDGDAAGGGRRRWAGGAVGRCPIAQSPGLLLPDGHAGLRTDGVLLLPQYQAWRRRRWGLPAAAHLVPVRLAIALDTAAAAAGLLLSLACPPAG